MANNNGEPNWAGSTLSAERLRAIVTAPLSSPHRSLTREGQIRFLLAVYNLMGYIVCNGKRYRHLSALVGADLGEDHALVAEALRRGALGMDYRDN